MSGEVIGSASIVVTPVLASNAQQKLAAEMNRTLQKLQSQQAASARRSTSAISSSQTNAFKQANASGRGLLSTVNQLKTGFAVLGGIVAGRFLQSIVSSRAEFERSQVAFKGLLAESLAVKAGFETTSQAVTGLTDDIRTLAIKSGADFGELARGAQSIMTTLGLSRGATVGLLTDIASAAAASGASLDSIPRALKAIAQISSRGFIASEELNQIADVLPVVARPKIYEELAKALGKTVAEITKLANEGGRITSAQGLPAIVRVMQQVAGAATGLDAQMQTVGGALNVLRGTAEAAVQEGFGGLSLAIQGIIDKAGGIEGLQKTFSGLIEPLDELASTSITAFVDTIIGIAPELENMAEAMSDLVVSLLDNDHAIKGAIETFNLLANAVSTVSGAFARITSVGDGINSLLVKIPGIGGIFERESDKLSKAAKETGESLARSNRAIENRASLMRELAAQAQVARDAEHEYAEAMKESTPQIEGVISAEGSRIDALEAIADALDTVKEAEQDLADLRSDRVLLIAEQLADVEERRAELLGEIVDLTEDLVDAEQAVADARQGVIDAEQAVTDARQGVLDANISVTDSERDLTDAREDLTEATQPATERELAAARRDVHSAEIALGNATRKRVEAEQALAALERRKLNQGKRLAVLGLDNLRTGLANARANAAAIRTVPDETELRADLASAIINEAEAAESLVESKEDLLELEQQGLDITDDVIEAREKVEKAERAVEAAVRGRTAAERAVEAALRDRAGAERDVVSALTDQTTAQVALTAAQNVDLALAPLVAEQKIELARFDGQIADAVERQNEAVRDVTKARQDERIAVQELNTELAILAGTENAENLGLINKIELYRELGRIGPAAYAAIQAELNALQPGVVETANQTPVIHGLLDFITNSVDIAQDSLGRFFLRKKNILNTIFKILPFAEGGIITKPTLGMMGEHSLKEVILPLTKPARAMQLAQQSGFLDMLSKHQQPFFPSASLGAAKASPTMIRTQRSGPSGSVAVLDPEVVAQLRALRADLAAAHIGETIDIDITGVGTVDDKLKMRQLSRQVEKAVRRGRR